MRDLSKLTPEQREALRIRNNAQVRAYRHRLRHMDVKGKCGCSRDGVEWDSNTGSFRCAFCKAWEEEYYHPSSPKRIYSGFRRVVEPYTVHLPAGFSL